MKKTTNYLLVTVAVVFSFVAMSFAPMQEIEGPIIGFKHYTTANCACTVGPVGLGGTQQKCFSLIGQSCNCDMPCEVYCGGAYVPCILCGEN